MEAAMIPLYHVQPMYSEASSFSADTQNTNR
jgi:hypothetical protein